MCDGVGPDFQLFDAILVACYAGPGVVEYLVFTGDVESDFVILVQSQSAACRPFELYDDATFLDRVRRVDRSLPWQGLLRHCRLELVHLAQRPPGGSLTDRPLGRRMDTLIRVRVVGGDQPGVAGGSPGVELDFTDDVGVVVHVVGHRPSVAPAGDLDDSEGQWSKRFTPLLDDQRKGLWERFPRLSERIVFTLVKEDTSKCEVLNWVDHAVEHAGRVPLLAGVLVCPCVGASRNPVSFFLRLVTTCLPFLQGLLVGTLGSLFATPLVPLFQSSRVLVEVRCHLRDWLQFVLGHPVLGHGSAPGYIDESDGDLQHPVEHFREVETHAGAIANVVGCRQLPVALAGLGLRGRKIHLRSSSTDQRNSQEANGLEVGRADLEVAIYRRAKSHRHVALAATQPHITNQYVVNHSP